MSAVDPFLAAIREALEDDAPRLIYADWLDEHGEPERAEFIRVQCELAQNDSPALRQREAELLAEHHNRFAGPMATPGLWFRFHRGCVVRFGHSGVFLAHEPDLPNWLLLLRFYSDGQVISACTGRSLQEFVELGVFNKDVQRTTKGTYVLDGAVYPSVMRIAIRPKPKAIPGRPVDGSADYCGAMNGGSLDVDVHYHEINMHRRIQYVHTPIDGFDSFSESP